jgi:uncharacterized membrane protein YjfL (UPF0719 family)
MTIRQYIRRRVGWGFAAFFGAFVVSSIVSALIGKGNVAIAISLIAGLIGITGYFSSNISMTIAIPTAARLFGRKVQFCPYCAVSLDEPIDKAMRH